MHVMNIDIEQRQLLTESNRPTSRGSPYPKNVVKPNSNYDVNRIWRNAETNQFQNAHLAEARYFKPKNKPLKPDNLALLKLKEKLNQCNSSTSRAYSSVLRETEPSKQTINLHTQTSGMLVPV